MKIDAHVHFSASNIKETMFEVEKIGIDMICLFSTIEILKKLLEEYPEKIIPIARLYLDEDKPEYIDKAKDQGMKGFKVIRPFSAYDHKSYFPLYEKAEKYNMPIIFHTGIVNNKGGERICDNMRPIYLDHIGRCFPDLKIIMAHLGNPWYEEGSMTCRYNENIVCDLSGSTLKKKSPEFIRSLFWWDKPGHPYKAHGDKHPFDKIVFGTDTAPEWMCDAYNDYQRLMDEMEVPEKYRKKIMGETSAEIFEIKQSDS